MEITNYFTSSNKEHWKMEIGRAGWSAAKFLLQMLNENSVEKYIGKDAELLLLTDGEKLVSFCTLAEKDEVDAPGLKPWIGFVFTFPEYRGNHYAGKSISHACKTASGMGYSTIYISTGETGLYEKYGFTFWCIMDDVWGEKTRVYFLR